MRLVGSCRGSALVEFALAIPVLLLLVLAVLDFGRGLNAYVTVRNAGAEGAHWAALHPGAAPADIDDAVRSRVVPLDASRVDIVAKYHDGHTWLDWPPSGIPATGPEPRYVPIVVEVSYRWSAITFLANFFPGGSGATFTSRATADAVR